MELSINGGPATVVNSADELSNLLTKWGVGLGDFVILEDGEADYIQSTIDEHGYIVEIRDGSTATMYRATRSMAQPDQSRDRWSRAEALALIQTFFPLRGRGGQAAWENMHMPTAARGEGAPMWVYSLVGLLIALVAILYEISTK
jgi:hypothetical protein